MSKIAWDPSTMLNPLPAVLVTSKHGKISNVLTVCWAGTICTKPPMVSISIRPERYSYDLIKKSGEFVINLPGENLVTAVDFCGQKSGRDIDKFATCKLNMEEASIVKAPLIRECPVAIEACVEEIKKLGSHHMFISKVLAVNVEKTLMAKNSNRFRMDKANLLCYNHGHYCSVSESLGRFGFSNKKIRKDKYVKLK